MPLVQQLVEVFTANANPARAQGQKAYMRNKFPFLGLTAPERKTLAKEVFKENPIEDKEDLQKAIRDL